MAFKDTSRKPFIEDRDTNIFIGLDLPIRRGDGKDGYFASTTTTIEAVKNNIRNLLLTQKGERLMQPNLGMNLRKYLFEPLGEENDIVIRDDILDTINFWLPFVQVKDINIQSGFGSDGKMFDKPSIKVVVVFSIKQDPNTLESVQVSLKSTAGDVTPVATGTGGGY